jgi:hypothetical protein
MDQSRQFNRKRMYLRRRTPEGQRHFEKELNQEGAEGRLCRRKNIRADFFRADFRSGRTSRQRRPGYDWPLRMGSGCLDLRLCCGRRPTREKLATWSMRFRAVHRHRRLLSQFGWTAGVRIRHRRTSTCKRERWHTPSVSTRINPTSLRRFRIKTISV